MSWQVETLFACPEMPIAPACSGAASMSELCGRFTISRKTGSSGSGGLLCSGNFSFRRRVRQSLATTVLLHGSGRNLTAPML